MQSSLRARLSAARSAAADVVGQQGSLRWYTLAAMWLAGGTLALVVVAFVGDAYTHTGWCAAISTFAVVFGLGMFLFGSRLSAADLPLSLCLLLGTVLLTVFIRLAGPASTVLIVIYLWIALGAVLFFRGALAFAHFASVAAGIGFLMATMPGSGAGSPVARWLIVVVAAALVCVLAHLLRERNDRLLADLSDAARTDPLTGLLNRRGFREVIAEELERARRTDTEVSVVIGDLDHFKVVNDRHGHHRGDEVLCAYARLAESTVRGIDSVARMGGEEFALVLPGTGPDGAHLLADRVRRATRDELASVVPGGLSISFGVASYPQHGSEPDDLLRHADQAMYLAKRMGRDRVVLYSEEVDRVAEREQHASAEQLPAVLLLAETLDLRHESTAAHSRAVARCAEAIARELGLGPERAERVRLAGLLHDVGKIGVPDTVLHKPDELTEAEWLEMRRHPELGARIIAGAGLTDIGAWVLAHHERPDGRGYPAGLCGEEIPIEARILAVADAFEAMTSDRVYRRGVAPEVAKAELRRHAGTQFDPAVVEALHATDGVPDTGDAAASSSPEG